MDDLATAPYAEFRRGCPKLVGFGVIGLAGVWGVDVMCEIGLWG